ncbi:MAG: hypothetical protein IGS16_14815 [Thermoleptolyngbya sp. C42_A2020_037]|nr:hypothetical protein [Thermoleptolyngbya sp. C42_A2020_037]
MATVRECVLALTDLGSKTDMLIWSIFSPYLKDLSVDGMTDFLWEAINITLDRLVFLAGSS